MVEEEKESAGNGELCAPHLDADVPQTAIFGQRSSTSLCRCKSKDVMPKSLCLKYSST